MKKKIIVGISIVIIGIIGFVDFFFVYHAKLVGDKSISLKYNTDYVDNGIVINYRGKKHTDYIVENNINNKKLGSYEVKYKVHDRVVKKRIVNVVDEDSPIIKLKGEDKVNVVYPNEYVDEGVSAIDDYDGDITGNVLVNGNINYNKLGEYNLEYIVSDSSNNIASKIRKINIVDKTSPKIELKRKINDFVFNGKELDLSYTAIDDYDGDITKNVIVEGNVNFNKDGKYYITYIVSDNSGNETRLKTSISVQSKNAKDVPVLMYHWFYDDTKGEKAGERNSHNYISKTTFEKQIKYLYDNNYYYPTWEELEDFIDGKIDLPEKSVILTDDDSSPSFFKIAYPVSKKYEVPFTSFVITSKKTYQKYFDEDYLDLQSHTDSMHVRSCHTVWDGKVMCSTYDEINNDINKSIEKLKNNVTVFAYPFGHYNDDTIKVLKNNGIKLAFTINEGNVKKGSNKYKLPRVRIASWTSQSAFISLVK